MIGLSAMSSLKSKIPIHGDPTASPRIVSIGRQKRLSASHIETLRALILRHLKEGVALLVVAHHRRRLHRLERTHVDTNRGQTRIDVSLQRHRVRVHPHEGQRHGETCPHLRGGLRRGCSGLDSIDVGSLHSRVALIRHRAGKDGCNRIRLRDGRRSRCSCRFSSTRRLERCHWTLSGRVRIHVVFGRDGRARARADNGAILVKRVRVVRAFTLAIFGWFLASDRIKGVAWMHARLLALSAKHAAVEHAQFACRCLWRLDRTQAIVRLDCSHLHPAQQVVLAQAALNLLELHLAVLHQVLPPSPALWLPQPRLLLIPRLFLCGEQRCGRRALCRQRCQH
mmetsp:Transcript_77969/g.114126  ORF Transcript_77969/g.114126 Transcript_77969/m.114126 type:complete len:339 (+) Transcript_77969:339-1355(+)